jgi:hypothetical protein
VKSKAVTPDIPSPERRHPMIFTLKDFSKRALIFLPILFVLFDAADCAGGIYYSIHFANLKSLKEVNRQTNLLEENGKFVFWETVEAHGGKRHYRVYMGRFTHWNDAVKFRNELRSAGVDSPLGIHWFSQSIIPDENEVSSTSAVFKRSRAAQRLSLVHEKDRFIDNRDGTITDAKTRLMWMKNGWSLNFLSAVSWFDAMDKCKQLTHGNYRDWRLPTVEEWRSLIDSNNKYPALVEPNPFVNIISHMPYWSMTEFTYSEKHTCTNECPLETYTVMLYSGDILHQRKNEKAFILPVRSMD